MSDYWNECISEALEDAGITATNEQIDTVASWVEGAHDNYGMAFGHDCIPNPLQTQVDDLRREAVKRQEDHDQRVHDMTREAGRVRAEHLEKIYQMKKATLGADQ